MFWSFNLHLDKLNDVGLYKGVHFWSIKVLGKSWHCYASIGVTTAKNKDILNRNGINYHWLCEGFYSYYRGYGEWKKDEVVTIKLDCDNWSVTYWKQDEELKTRKIKPSNYHMVLLCCNRSAITHMEIVETPQNLTQHR